MIGLIAVTAAGRAAAARLTASWPGETRAYDGPAAGALPQAWTECDGIVCFLAAGAVIRLIAPLLAGKRADPAVICVDEAARFAVSLIGGHVGGANALAVRAALALGAEPVITTASDATGLPGLDDLGWPAEGAVAAVTRALLDGGLVTLDSDETWPLPALPADRAGESSAGRGPDGVSSAGPSAGGAGTGEPVGYRILVTDRIVPDDPRTAVLRPPSLVVGVGASKNVSDAEVLGLIDAALAEAGLSPLSVTALATVDAKAAEPGLVAAARQRGWPLLTYPAARLAAVPAPNPSRAALAAVGTPSVAEAAALASADVLAVQKRKSPMATVAIGQVRPRGRLAVVGLGPGARDLLAPRAVAELRRASVVVGLGQYVSQIRDLLRPGTDVLTSELGAEEERAKAAVTRAREGHAVALVGSGDAGVYAMASPALLQAGGDIEVVVVPGITASLAAGALLGAPLGHDHAVISLSDLHTPWEVIESRVRAAAEGDYVTVFYNPRSRGRHWQLGAALAVLAAYRPPGTPAAIVRNASRPGQRVLLTTVAEFDLEAADMLSLVIVGASTTQAVAGRMVTPRGYAWQP
ncbi:MAG TPA: precorrin-3B C(17)-methyltransferase [Trebonia sp.]